jgi:hypothetical protein
VIPFRPLYAYKANVPEMIMLSTLKENKRFYMCRQVSMSHTYVQIANLSQFSLARATWHQPKSMCQQLSGVFGQSKREFEPQSMAIHLKRFQEFCLRQWCKSVPGS